MTSSDEGFFFSFGDEEDNQAGVESGTRAAAPVSWDAPATLTSRFPWQTLDHHTIAEWLKCYCTTTKPRELALPGESGGASLSLCYQTSPEVTDLTSVQQESRDIVPGRYYGGLKVWSCAILLAEYMMEIAGELQGRLSSAGVVVGEVGCGQGLPGLTALCLGAPSVVFQDYNIEVLQHCVMPNIAATVSRNSLLFSAMESPPRVQLIHGDWVDLQWDNVVGDAVATANGHSFCDVVLGADVTFDKEACEKLACLLQRWLRPRTGIALIASKDYYFGTNGGCMEFANAAARYSLDVSVRKRVETDDKMPHVLLQVTKPE